MQKPIDRSTTCLRYLSHTWRRGLRLTWSIYSLCSSPDHKGDSRQDTRFIRLCFQNISIVRCQQISVVNFQRYQKKFYRFSSNLVHKFLSAIVGRRSATKRIHCYSTEYIALSRSRVSFVGCHILIQICSHSVICAYGREIRFTHVSAQCVLSFSGR